LTYLLLILTDQLLQLIHALGERERVAGEFAILSLNCGQAKRTGESLIDLVIGEPFGLARVLVFLGRNREGGKGLCRLPRPKVDDGLLDPGGTTILSGRGRDWKVQHGVPRGPPKDETQDQQSDQDQQDGVGRPAEESFANVSQGTGNERGRGHATIVTARLARWE
jgi:hypothetical protein